MPSLNVQPLRPNVPFTDDKGNLTIEGYHFLYNMYLRIGGSLDSLNAVTLADKTWDAPNPIGSTTPSTGKFTTLQVTSTFSVAGAMTATSAATFSPANNTVTVSPTGTGTFVANPATTGTFNNISMGATTPASGKFTTLESTGKVTVGSGVIPTGSGLKHVRISTGSIGALSSDVITHTWGTAFADANYTVSANVVDSTTSSTSLQVVHIEAISASQVQVRVQNTSAGPLTGTLHLIAIHD